ncbi:MAG: adenine phosphoribosyltransferase [candidate division KSB1 bacterium]|nr:adenine phosphoribosyltransferase [candidate division KSB1 bacterium]
MEQLKHLIRNVPDFPKKGIGFKDITTLIKDGKAFRKAVDDLAEPFQDKGVDLVVGVEARGFIFAAALAYKWGVGVIPVRKPGKLPAETLKEEYALEYGTDAVEIHKDAIQKGQRVLIVDDLLATGGTVAATARLVERLGGQIVGIAFLIELSFLKGREKLKKYQTVSLIKFDEE